MARPRFLPDNFTLYLIGALLLASFLPCRGMAASVLNIVTNLAIALLFFFHGAKLSRTAIVAGITH
ncbi:sodium/bile acid cotransporter 7 [Pseudomonas duriflava]|uniref:Sodium/bile acid cotransporter 7 n=1 Tax=Pseudomonas duriflava TaxID=459528 RepID=A0A562Q2T1_9PSED|nr:sodium/bile acid cotransporter 7 [Pseudomonas duriflava]